MQDLELDIILKTVAEYAVSEPAKKAVSGVLPCNSFAEVAQLLKITDEMRMFSERYGFCVPPFADITDSAAKAKIGGVLNPAQLLNIAAVCKAARVFKSAADKDEEVEILAGWANAITPQEDLERAINAAVEDSENLKDDASPQLRTVRRRIIACGNKLKDKLTAYSRGGGEYAKYLQDNIVTVRGGRFVLPVKAEFRPNVAGIVHDKSAGGATIFVEPFAVVELNNELRELKAEEVAEVERILRELSGMVAAVSDELVVAQEFVVMADVALAKYLYGKSINAVMPDLCCDKKIKITAGRHPLIDPGKVVPIDLEFSGIMLLSGPNTGGKTVALKTVGLFCVLAACGIFVPAVSAELPVFDKVCCDIGDGQSIAESLSTFSSRVLRLKNITDNMNAHSLLLLDELGAGTDPTEGAALAIGVIERIREAGATAVITTHFGELKKYSAGDDKIIGASMQFDEQTLLPTYRLIMNLPGASNALKTAERLGLDTRITDTARKFLDPKHLRFENALSEAQKLKTAALEELEQAKAYKEDTERLNVQAENERAKLAKQREELAKTARSEVSKLVESSRDKAADIIAKIKECLARGDEAAFFEARKLAAGLDSIETADEIKREFKPIAISKIVAGAAVYIIPADCAGVVVSVDTAKRVARVKVGIMTVEVKFGDLGDYRVANACNDSKCKARIAPTLAQPETREINIIGQTVSEGTAAVELFLEECFAAGIGAVRIIHGKGTGTLGRGIQLYLRTAPTVAAYRYGDISEGGKGATIVELEA